MRNKHKKTDSSVIFTVVFSAVLFLISYLSFGQTNLISSCVGLIIPGNNSISIIKKNYQEKKQYLFSNSDSTDSTTSAKKENSTQEVYSNTSLAHVPNDIQKMINSAKKAEKNDKEDGKIVEMTYSVKSATDKYQNILVRNTTSKKLDIPKVLSEKPDLKIDKNKPSILIIHTHTTESYQILDRGFYAQGFLTRSNESTVNMARVGKEITDQLRNAGYNVIHDTKIHDSSYSAAYSNSGKAIDEHLKKYPSIQVILDIHRDAIEDKRGTKTKPITTIGGKKAAQLMIISGCQEDGITGFDDWQYNLRFAMQLQKICEDMYPTISRPLLFSARKYVMHKSRNSLLIEIGSDSNTLDEAAYTARLLGNVLSKMLEKYTL